MDACRAKINIRQVVRKRVTRSSRKSESISSSNLITNKIGTAGSECTSKTIRARHGCEFTRTETEEQEQPIKIRPVCVRCPKLHLETRCMLLKDIPSSAIASNVKELQCREKATLSGNSNSSHVSRRENTTYNGGQSFGSENSHSYKSGVLGHKSAHNDQQSHIAFSNNEVIIAANEKGQSRSRESADCSSSSEHTKVTMRAHKIDSPAITSPVCLNAQGKGSKAADVKMDSIPNIISVMTRLVEAVESNIQSNVTTTTNTMERVEETTQITDAECEDAVKERVFNALTKFFSNLRTIKNEPIQDQNDAQECEPDSTACATNDDLENNLPIQPPDATAIKCINSKSNSPKTVLTPNLNGTELEQPTQMYKSANLLVAEETTSLSGHTMSEVDLNLMCSEDEPHGNTDSDSLTINPCDSTKSNDISSAAEVTDESKPTKESANLNLASSNYRSKNEGELQPIEINPESCISVDAADIDADQQANGEDRSASTLDTDQRISNLEEETQILVNNIPDTDHPISEDGSEYSEVHNTVDEIITSLEASEENDIQDISNIDQGTVEENSNLLVAKGSNETNKKEREPCRNNFTQNSVMTHSVRKEAETDNNLKHSRNGLSDSEGAEKFSSPSKVDAILLKSIQSIKRSKSRTTLKNAIYTSTEEEDSSDECLQKLIVAPFSSNNRKPDENKHKKQIINKTSKQLPVFSSEVTDLSSSSDDEIIDLTQNDDTEPKKNRFELELQILKDLIKEKQVSSSQAEVENVKSSTSTHASDKASNQKKKPKPSKSKPEKSESKQVKLASRKAIPIKMIAPKGTLKKRSIEEAFTVSTPANEHSSDEEVLQSNNEARKKKKLGILENLPTATEIKITKKDKVKTPKDQPTLPKTLSSKVKSVLSAGESDVPIVSKKSKKKKTLADRSSSPERIWKSLSVFDTCNEENSIASKKVYKPTSLNANTDFVVQPLNIKSQKTSLVPEYLSSTALDFKRKSIFNDKIRRESSKDLLKRKIRKKF